MKHKVIHARDVLAMTEEEIWRWPTESFILRFDDGDMVTNTRRTIYSWYHWDAHRRYDIPLLQRHHMGKKVLSDKTSIDILSAVSRDVHYTLQAGYDREPLWKLFYEIVNNIYNVFIVKLAAYQTSSNILDYLEIFDDPDVQEANANLRPNQSSLDECYHKITEVIRTKDSLRHNPVVAACRSSLVKQDQINQIVGPRGYLTDADSNIFEYPILTGYLEGITGLYESMVESRSAVKALTFTKNPLQQVEYFNRKMQLIASRVRGLIFGDCGSNEFILFPVSSDALEKIEGKYYLDEGSNKLKIISQASRDLIGRTIKMRSPTKCRYRGDHMVCSTCMGELAWSVPYDTNLGHVSASEMCQEGSQLVLSVKHYDGSSVVMPLSISEHDSDYIEEGSDSGTILLKEQIKHMKPYFILESVSRPPAENAAGLASLTKSTDVSSLSIHRLTSFRDVKLGIVTKEGDIVEDYISVSQGGRLGSFSEDFLTFIIDHGYQITDDGSYRVELENWDYSKVVFKLPLRHLNMLDYMSEIEVFIRSPSDASRDARLGASKKLIDYTSIDEALIDLYELASSKLSVNIAHLEVLLLAMMRNAADPDDYSIPDIDQPVMFERHSRLMEMGSLGNGFAFERQPAIIENVDSYLLTDRPPSVYDALLIGGGSSKL